MENPDTTSIPSVLDADGRPVVSAPPTPEKPKRPLWRTLYGWVATVATRKVPGLQDIHGKDLEEILSFPRFYTKAFTHQPKDIVLGAPKRGGVASTWEKPKNQRQARRHHQTKPVKYMVWHDKSLRRVDKLIKKQLAGMTKEQQAEFVSKALAEKPSE